MLSGFLRDCLFSFTPFGVRTSVSMIYLAVIGWRGLRSRKSLTNFFNFSNAKPAFALRSDSFVNDSKTTSLSLLHSFSQKRRCLLKWQKLWLRNKLSSTEYRCTDVNAIEKASKHSLSSLHLKNSWRNAMSAEYMFTSNNTVLFSSACQLRNKTLSL